MRISMDCLLLEVYSEALYSDLLIHVAAVFVSYRCESGPGKLRHGDELKDCSDGTQSQWFYWGFFLLFLHKMLLDHNVIYPNSSAAWAVSIEEQTRVQTFEKRTSRMVVCSSSTLSSPAPCQTASWKWLRTFSLVFFFCSWTCFTTYLFT